jgi:hypothetical protein
MYKEIILNSVVDYLRIKKWKMSKSGKVVMIKCPYCTDREHESANLIPFTSIINTFCCKKKLTLIDFVRALEPDKKDWTEDKILEHVKNLLKLDVRLEHDSEKMKNLLDFYEANGFDLVPQQKGTNDKFIEEHWKDAHHKDRKEWENWLEMGVNFSIRCGSASGVTGIDIDMADIPADLLPLLGKTATYDTTRGHHFLYKFDPDLKGSIFILDFESEGGEKITLKNPNIEVIQGTSKKRIRDMKLQEFGQINVNGTLTKVKLVSFVHLDIQTDGDLITIPPSVVAGKVREFNELVPLATISPELKEWLQGKLQTNNSVQASQKVDSKPGDDMYRFPLLKEGEGRNDLLVHLGGMFSKEMPMPQVEYGLTVLNNVIFDPPLTKQEIKAMCRKIGEYRTSDQSTMAQDILDYMKKVEDADKEAIRSALNISREGVEKESLDVTLTSLFRDGFITRRGRYYRLTKKTKWMSSLMNQCLPIDFKVPYFDDIAHFNWGDMVLIGAPPKVGKTHLAMNIAFQLRAQGITPHYIFTEPGGRHAKIAITLGMKDGDLLYPEEPMFSPEDIILEPGAVTIIDWLQIDDKARTDTIFRELNKQLYKTKGFLIVFQQLKEVQYEYGKKGAKNPREMYQWFAPNLIKQFPSLAAMYLYDDISQMDGKYGAFYIDACREPKITNKKHVIPCVYNAVTKVLCRIEDLKENQETAHGQGQEPAK